VKNPRITGNTADHAKPAHPPEVLRKAAPPLVAPRKRSHGDHSNRRRAPQLSLSSMLLPSSNTCACFTLVQVLSLCLKGAPPTTPTLQQLGVQAASQMISHTAQLSTQRSSIVYRPRSAVCKGLPISGHKALSTQTCLTTAAAPFSGLPLIARRFSSITARMAAVDTEAKTAAPAAAAEVDVKEEFATNPLLAVRAWGVCGVMMVVHSHRACSIAAPAQRSGAKRNASRRGTRACSTARSHCPPNRKTGSPPPHTHNAGRRLPQV